MKFRALLSLSLCFVFASCADKIISIVKTKPLQSQWEFSEAGKNNWNPAIVPGLVLTDLLKNGKIEQPLFEENEQKLQWIHESDWVYRTDFEISDSLLKFKAIDFIFKGIDTYASIYLNDSLLLQADNMFREWRANGKRFLRSGSNRLTVQLHSPSREAMKAVQKIQYRLPMSDPGDQKFSAFIRKAAYQFGWDWSPRFLTMGIWQPVSISAHDKVYISGMQLRTLEIADTCAWLSAFVTVNSAFDLPNAAVTVHDGYKPYHIKKGISVIEVKFRIDQPELWWPIGFGKQSLYSVVAKLYVNTFLVDSITGRTGIRTVELFQDEDEWGTGFYFRINGLPIFMKGANYVPQSSFLTEVGENDYKHIIKDVKAVGMNMLRVWGGGSYEGDYFYNLCDENGILIWQDFMFAGAMYPGDSAFINNAKHEVEYQVQRLANHPCIVLWCGNNEAEVAWNNWGWQKEFNLTPSDSTTIYNNYLKLFQEIIPSIVTHDDNTRPYLPSSPSKNWGTKENFLHGNMHYWGVWHGEEAIDSLRVNVPRFMTEYGMQSYPSYTSLKANTTSERITLNSDFIKNRQRSYKGNGLLIKYIEDQFGPVKNTEDLCYLSQLNQAEAMRIAIESQRRQARFCMGSLYWQLNDVWDGASWSTLEHNGTWKAAHYALNRLYSQNLLITETKNDTVAVYFQSDNTNGSHGTLQIEVMDFKGRRLGNYKTEAGVGYLVAEKYFEMSLKQLLRNQDPEEFLMHITLSDGDSVLASANHFFVAPKDLNLPDVKISYNLESSDTTTVIRLKSETLAKGVMMEFENTPGHFSDNYFDLLPGEAKVVRFDGAKPATNSLIIKHYNH